MNGDRAGIFFKGVAAMTYQSLLMQTCDLMLNLWAEQAEAASFY